MRRTTIVFILLLLYPTITFSQTINNYLILNDIGEYKYRPKRTIEIYGNSGILISTGHFTLDHDDITYETRYVHPATILGVSVQITQHAGSDSDRWLLHEVEDIFRSNRNLGELISGTEIRDINSNRILNWISYAWVSGNVVVYITWTPKPEVQNPEPLEIIQAYLQKFSSTIPTTLTLDQAHDEQWIKDEMERRLWLCDKWFMALQLQKAELDKVLRESVDHMDVFLDYREKYYGISARKEKGVLWEYLKAKNGTAIKNKLTEYKTWWEANKDKAINL